MLVLCCLNVNVICGYRIKMYIFSIIVNGLNEFIVGSDPCNQTWRMLIFWKIIFDFAFDHAKLHMAFCSHYNYCICCFTKPIFNLCNVVWYSWELFPDGRPKNCQPRLGENQKKFFEEKRNICIWYNEPVVFPVYGSWNCRSPRPITTSANQRDCKLNSIYPHICMSSPHHKQHI